MPNLARIRSAQIMPSGNTIAICFEQAASPNADAGFALNGLITPPTVKVDGVTLTLTNWLWRVNRPWLWAPLNKSYTAIIDDLDSGGVFTKTGSGWNQLTGYDTGQHDRIFYANSCVFTTDPAATATFTFTGVLPGEYRISVPSLHGNAVYTSDALLTVYDNTSSVATIHVNQKTSPDPWNFTENQYRWANVGTATVASTTLKVVFSNPGNDGYLVADAVRIERIHTGANRIAPPSSTVTITAGSDGWVNTNIGTVGAVTNYAVTHATDADWFPYDAGITRTMEYGYNLDEARLDYPGRYYANRFKTMGGWHPLAGVGSISTDAYGNLTNIADGTNAEANLVAGNFLGYNAPPHGVWRIAFTEHGSCNVTLVDQTSEGGVTIGAPVDTGIVGRQADIHPAGRPDAL
jgi:hypothetical protein